MMRDLSGLSGDRLDQAFLQDMIGHHMAAVMMSQHLLRGGAEHGEVAELAREIRDGQHAEIVTMRRWLALWFDLDLRSGMECGMPTASGWGMASHLTGPGALTPGLADRGRIGWAPVGLESGQSRSRRDLGCGGDVV